MSYISPIKLNTLQEMEDGWTDKVAKYIAGETDKLVLESCMKVKCDINKEELIKALQYDRGQYEKGYADGKRDAAAAIEELQADNDILRHHIDDLDEAVFSESLERQKAEAEVKRLKGCNDELREAQTYIDHYGDKWLTSAKDVPTSAYNHGYMDGKNEAEQALETKRGEWIESEETEWGIYPFKKKTCSVCDCKIDHTFMLACMDYFDDRDTEFHYCPNCGAKMEVQDGQ